MDEPSGSTSIADIIGGRDLALLTGGSGPDPTFEADGPFPDLPAQTSIEFSGSEGVGGNQARFELAISAGERDAIFAITSPTEAESVSGDDGAGSAIGFAGIGDESADAAGLMHFAEGRTA